MIFVKTSHGTQKCHFLDYKKGWLELVFEKQVFVNYIRIYLQNATSMCK